ncbi:MAG: hypothetical protein ACI33S_03055 [Bacilli bacterium]
MNYSLMLDQIIINIEKGNYKYEFINGGYNYSDEITDIFKILEYEKYKTIFYDNIKFYSYKEKKELDQKIDPEQYTLVDCVIVLNWIWHVESSIAVGNIMKKLRNGSYLKMLKQFRKLMK